MGVPRFTHHTRTPGSLHVDILYPGQYILFVAPSVRWTGSSSLGLWAEYWVVSDEIQMCSAS